MLHKTVEKKKYISDLSGVKWRGKSEIKYEKVK